MDPLSLLANVSQLMTQYQETSDQVQQNKDDAAALLRLTETMSAILQHAEAAQRELSAAAGGPPSATAEALAELKAALAFSGAEAKALVRECVDREAQRQSKRAKVATMFSDLRQAGERARRLRRARERVDQAWQHFHLRVSFSTLEEVQRLRQNAPSPAPQLQPKVEVYTDKWSDSDTVFSMAAISRDSSYSPCDEAHSPGVGSPGAARAAFCGAAAPAHHVPQLAAASFSERLAAPLAGLYQQHSLSLDRHGDASGCHLVACPTCKHQLQVQLPLTKEMTSCHLCRHPFELGADGSTRALLYWEYLGNMSQSQQ